VRFWTVNSCRLLQLLQIMINIFVHDLLLTFRVPITTEVPYAALCSQLGSGWEALSRSKLSDTHTQDYSFLWSEQLWGILGVKSNEKLKLIRVQFIWRTKGWLSKVNSANINSSINIDCLPLIYTSLTFIIEFTKNTKKNQYESQ